MIGKGEFYAASAAAIYAVATVFARLYLKHIPLGIYSVTRSAAGTLFFFIVVSYLFGPIHFVDLASPFLWKWMVVYGGLIIVSSDAQAAGATASPGPGSDREQAWIWTGQLFVSSGDEAAVVDQRLSTSIAIDSKAQRKMKQGDTLVFMVEVLAAEYEDQAGTLNFGYAVDCLARLN